MSTKTPSAMGPQAPPRGPVAHPSQPGKRFATAVPTAVGYCEGDFGQIDGKTANDLVRFSQVCRILWVIDSAFHGHDRGQVLGSADNTVPVPERLESPVTHEARGPDWQTNGMAPSTGNLSLADRAVVLDAIARGLNIVSGLHEYLGEDPVTPAAAHAAKVTIRHIRKLRPSEDMRLFEGSVASAKAIPSAVPGTDCAIGKRTTATVLASALSRNEIHTILVGAGQTGLMLGARYSGSQ